jgi:hypothetical protein
LKGFIAIEARSSVEVNEVSVKDLLVADVADIPDKLNEMAQNPLLLTYKFTSPSYSLKIDIKKHDGKF